MPKTTSFRHMKLHVKSQIVMYVNNKPSLHINLRDLLIYLLHLFIALNNLIISYIPFIAMHNQLNLVPIIIYIITLYFMSGAHGGCGVCGGGGWVSVDRRLFHRCGASVDLELLCLKTLLSLEVKGSSEGILYDEIYIFCMCI